eukprot:SAG22_NODE_4944_length_1124_cov_1.654634_1_plen_139_part_00
MLISLQALDRPPRRAVFAACVRPLALRQGRPAPHHHNGRRGRGLCARPQPSSTGAGAGAGATRLPLAAVSPSPSRWRALAGDTLAGGGLALFGDVACQLAVEGAAEMDWRRCAAMTSFGALYTGALCHYVYPLYPVCN